MSSSEANTRRRVKLYTLNEDRQWDDKGTGHVSALYTEQNNIALVVISESDGSCLLESKIQPDTAYQKQQETLIVWSEGDNTDLALSFQEKAGCDDIWEKICTVQGKDPSVEITQDVVDESDDADDVEAYTPNANQSLQTFELPPCELSRLSEIAELLIEPQGPGQRRERIVATFERTNYLRQLVDLFHKAEDLEDSESLHYLYEIFRHIILINKQNLHEILFSDDMIMDIIGILEYNPAGRTRHRDFLRDQATFKEVLPLHNLELVNKIHQTYRVQYIQDCCLPPPCLFDESTMNVLKSFITFNKIDIISALQEDEEFMLQLFTCLKSLDTSESHRRELALFVKEFCNFSVQTEQKDNFLNCLFSHGALPMVEVLLTYDDHDVKAAALELLHAFVENQPSVVREYVYKDNSQISDDSLILVNLMITQLLNDPDPELSDAFVLGYMLRILIDPDNMNNTGGRGEKTEFLSFFYKRCVGTLAKPLFDNTIHETPLHDDYHTALVLSNVLELLTFCIENHSYHMKNYCLHRDIVKRVLVLLRSSHKFLVLGALRLLRRVVNLKEDFYNRYLVKHDLLKPVIDLFLSNGHRYNMIDSAVIELFDYIRVENINQLLMHTIERHWDILKDVTYVQTFIGLKERYDILHRPIRTDSPLAFGQQTAINVLPLRPATSARFHRPSTEFDDEEEQWFRREDDEDDDESLSPGGILPHGISSTSSGSLSNSLSSSIDSLVYCRTSILSTLPTSTSMIEPNTGPSAVTPFEEEDRIERNSPEHTPPSHGPIPFHERSSGYAYSPIPLRPGLIRHQTPISINIKSGNLFNGPSTFIPDSNTNGASNDLDKKAPIKDSPPNDHEIAACDADTTGSSFRPGNSSFKRSYKLPSKQCKRAAIASSTVDATSDDDRLDETGLDCDRSETAKGLAENTRLEGGIVGLVDYSDEESDEEADSTLSETQNRDVSTTSAGSLGPESQSTITTKLPSETPSAPSAIQDQT